MGVMHHRLTAYLRSGRNRTGRLKSKLEPCHAPERNVLIHYVHEAAAGVLVSRFRPALLSSLRATINPMSTSLPASSTPNFQPILDKALVEYKKTTSKDLITHPLAQEIKGCDTPAAILTVLQGKANDLNRSRGSDERLTKWLTPTVNVLNALSATLGAGVGTVTSGDVAWSPARVLTISFRYFPLPKSSFLESASYLW